ncbi:MAG: sensor domain-containing diguanylate cyclase [Rhizobacter sp.]|nr:sensor domain-containing diguanylate cyclase [Rhizobacter sp.]
MMATPSDPGTGNLLQAMGIDDPAAMKDFELLARVASLVTGAPNAFISFSDGGNLWRASSAVTPEQCVSRERAFCSALLESDDDTLVCSDVRRDPRTRVIAGSQPESPVVTYAGALLKTDDGRRLGTLCVTDHLERPPDAEQIDLLRGLARQSMNLVSLRAAKRELIEALAQMTHLARTDALTGLLNRRAFYEEAEALRKLVTRQHDSMSLVILDLDHFKRINDGLGHAAGDTVLGEIGRLLQAELRATDRVGRIGGEEFAIAMPFTTMHAAAQRIDRLRQQIADSPIVHGEHRITVTVSGGVAELQTAEQSIDGAMRRADRALYRAKAAGRDHIQLASAKSRRAAAPKFAPQSEPLQAA